MTIAIRLLGSPSITVDDVARPLKGRKTWGMLAYLLLEGTAPSRHELAERLWSEADDPLSALRWTLLQIRRSIDPATIDEDASRLRLSAPDDALQVDALALFAGAIPAENVDGMVGGALLGPMSFDRDPMFDGWLALQRARAASASAEALRWAASMLAPTDPARALSLLERSVVLDPFNDGAHESAVEIHLSRGDRAAAQDYVARVGRMYRAELGIDAPDTFARPLSRPAPQPSTPLVSIDVQARALLRSAEARLEAGDYEGAVDRARRAASDAATSGDTLLEARALTTLGGVLVHTLRGRDREALGLLERAVRLASAAGDDLIVADAEREIGYIALLEGRYGAAEASLARSAALADKDGDPVRGARARSYRGLCRSDRGDFGPAEEDLRSAIEQLADAGERSDLAYAQAVLARLLCRTGRYEEAITLAEDAVATARASGALWIIPWAMVHGAEAAMLAERASDAEDLFGEAFTLACEMDDPCWEGLSLRGLALLRDRSGDAAKASELLEDALKRTTRVADAYRWAEAVIRVDLLEMQGSGADPVAVREVMQLVTGAPMGDLVERLSRFSGSQTEPQTPAR